MMAGIRIFILEKRYLGFYFYPIFTHFTVYDLEFASFIACG